MVEAGRWQCFGWGWAGKLGKWLTSSSIDWTACWNLGCDCRRWERDSWLTCCRLPDGRCGGSGILRSCAERGNKIHRCCAREDGKPGNGESPNEELHDFSLDRKKNPRLFDVAAGCGSCGRDIYFVLVQWKRPTDSSPHSPSHFLGPRYIYQFPNCYFHTLYILKPAALILHT